MWNSNKIVAHQQIDQVCIVAALGQLLINVEILGDEIRGHTAPMRTIELGPAL